MIDLSNYSVKSFIKLTLQYPLYHTSTDSAVFWISSNFTFSPFSHGWYHFPSSQCHAFLQQPLFCVGSASSSTSFTVAPSQLLTDRGSGVIKSDVLWRQQNRTSILNVRALCWSLSRGISTMSTFLYWCTVSGSPPPSHQTPPESRQLSPLHSLPEQAHLGTNFQQQYSLGPKSLLPCSPRHCPRRTFSPKRKTPSPLCPPFGNNYV